MPFLSDDPHGLYDAMLAQVATHPRQSLRQHFLGLIEWLRVRKGRDFWIERTGASTNMFPSLRALFPDAKYLHIHRDGPECALSMRNFLDLSLKVSYHFNPPTEEELERTLDVNRPEESDPLVYRANHPAPVEQFGEFWSFSLEKFYAETRHLRPEQLHEVRYEDLVDRTEEVLAEIADYFEMPRDEDWIQRAAIRVKRPLGTRADKLPPDERRRLEAACRAGQILVGRDPGFSPALTATLKWGEMIRRLPQGKTLGL